MTATTKQPNSDKLSDIAKSTGLAVMAVAATLGMLEVPEHPNNKIALNMQPTFAFATEQGGSDTANTNVMRRERDESVPHYISYSAIQRTPSRTGKQ